MEGANTYYYHNDYLGTPQVMTDSAGVVKWSADYKPFGEAINITGSITNNLRFPGQYYDAETGLNYNYFRDYNPVIGRYIESDPLGIQQGENQIYAYVRNNPLLFLDEEGLWPAGVPRTVTGPPHREAFSDDCSYLMALDRYILGRIEKLRNRISRIHNGQDPYLSQEIITNSEISISNLDANLKSIRVMEDAVCKIKPCPLPRR
jgi:RHS repeat-associated core domain